jgi:serine/threonine protein kinase
MHRSSSPAPSGARLSLLGSRLSVLSTTSGSHAKEIADTTPATSKVEPMGLPMVIQTAHKEHGDGPILTGFGMRWGVVGILGRGVFGDIYHVQDKITGEFAAAKVEPHECPRKLLLTETELMDTLSRNSAAVPRVFEFGETPTHEYVVMELVGKSIAELKSALGGRFTLSTGIRLAILMANALKDVQMAGITHGDVKLANFALGTGERARDVYVIDFGLSRPFPTEIKKSNFRGTVKYSSLNSHDHVNTTARDDMISWFYNVVEMVNGELPWGELCKTSKQNRGEVESIKREWNNPMLVANLPLQFTRIMDHIWSLQFFDMPNFDYIHAQLIEALAATHTDWDTLYDWETPAGQAAVRVHKAKFGSDPYIPTGALGRSNVGELAGERRRVDNILKRRGGGRGRRGSRRGSSSDSASDLSSADVADLSFEDSY